MDPVNFFVVDAFTQKVFSGNPAAVCVFNSKNVPDDTLCQNIAMEMNLSETAFVRPINGNLDTASEFGLRWFTPLTEVDLCGHATLATAHVLFNVFGNKKDRLEFETRSGRLAAWKTDSGQICMDFPRQSVRELEEVMQNRAEQSIDIFGLEDGEVDRIVQSAIGHLEKKSVVYESESKKLIIILDSKHSRTDLEDLHVDTENLKLGDPEGRFVRRVVLTLKGSRENGCVDDDGQVYDYVSRYFAPWVGIPEDPATGSSHCALAPYWSACRQPFCLLQPFPGFAAMALSSQRSAIASRTPETITCREPPGCLQQPILGLHCSLVLCN